MSAISSLSSTASQYQTDTQSPWQHGGKAHGAHHGLHKSNKPAALQQTLRTVKQNPPQVPITANRINTIFASFQSFQDALSSGEKQISQASDVEESEYQQRGSGNGDTMAVM